jgi:DNA topoisomerase-1
VVKEDRPGITREYSSITLTGGVLKEKTLTEITGAEKAKMFPTDIGMVVNDFLMKNFDLIMDYNFTAKVEAEFDEIAIGKLKWDSMIGKFYQPFHQIIESTLENSERSKGERILGVEPESGNQVSVKIGRFGPIAQIGEATPEGEEKPRFASLRPGQRLETITLEEALELFRLPRELGIYENKKVVVGTGRFGPYIRHDNKFVSLAKTDDPYSVTLERSIELILAKRDKEEKSVIKLFENDPDLKILNGRWGPYIFYKKENYKIPKGKVAEELSYNDCHEIIKQAPLIKKAKK